jgi:uracil-DNA glycosylase
MDVYKEYENLIYSAEQLIEQESLFNPEFFTHFKICDDIFSDCKTCNLSGTFSPQNPGVGSQKPILMVISDKPEKASNTFKSFDITAGNLFTKMLSAMGVGRDEVFITTFFKCMEANIKNSNCRKTLERQIKSLKPNVILALGETTSSMLLERKDSLEDYRNDNLTFMGKPFYATYHPRELVIDPKLKKNSWSDLQKIMKVMGK